MNDLELKNAIQSYFIKLILNSKLEDWNDDNYYTKDNVKIYINKNKFSAKIYEEDIYFSHPRYSENIQLIVSNIFINVISIVIPFILLFLSFIIQETKISEMFLVFAVFSFTFLFVNVLYKMIMFRISYGRFYLLKDLKLSIKLKRKNSEILRYLKNKKDYEILLNAYKLLPVTEIRKIKLEKI